LDVACGPDYGDNSEPALIQIVILVGTVGSFLNAVAGITGLMLWSSWAAAGGWSEWGSRLLVGYPCACLLVFTSFPFMVPRLTQRLEAHWAKQDQRGCLVPTTIRWSHKGRDEVRTLTRTRIGMADGGAEMTEPPTGALCESIGLRAKLVCVHHALLAPDGPFAPSVHWAGFEQPTRLIMTYYRLLPALMFCSLISALAPAAWAQSSSTEAAYVPQRGQPGKDVMWIPTPEGLIDKMLEVARVGPDDLVFDLGAGDGIIAITAAGRHGARAVGIEYNPQLADFARRKVREAGLNGKVRIITGDIFKEDFSAATVVTLYLYPDLNMRLRPTILAMKPGTRVVSHAFTMGDWEPDETVSHQSARAFYWTVPAQVEGEWTLNGLDSGPVKLSLRQSFQQIGGIATIQGVNQPLVGARLRGDELSFKISLPDRQLASFTGRVSARAITGSFNTPSANLTVEARRN
jgi:hypothetical protein